MVVYIPQNRITRFDLFGFQWEVGFTEAIKKRTDGLKRLTNDVAMKLFKEIKWQSHLLVFLSDGILLTGVSLVLISLGACISPIQKTALATQLLMIVRVLSFTLGGWIGGFAIENSFNGFLPPLKQAYYEQYLKATEYLDQIRAENSQGRQVTVFLP